MTDIVIPPALLEKLRLGQGVLVWGWGNGRDSLPALKPAILAQLPFHVIITTDQTQNLYRVLKQAGRQPVVISGDADIGLWDDRRMRLIQLQIESAEDAPTRQLAPWALEAEAPRLVDILCHLFATHAVLFAGWNGSDEILKHLYQGIVRDFGTMRPSVYALANSALSQADKEYWEAKGWQLLGDGGVTTNKDIGTFLRLLTEQAQISKPVVKAATHILAADTVPYKYLNYFEESDADAFCGRDSESEQLCSQALTHRLVLLFGPSGVGKTSLIRAGAIPRLLQASAIPVYCRAGDNPLAAFEDALQRLGFGEMLGQEFELEQPLAANIPTLRETVGQRLQRIFGSPDPTALPVPATQADVGGGSAKVKSALEAKIKAVTSREKKNIVLFIDQFEEFLVGTSLERQRSLMRTFSDLVADEANNLHAVVSIREDFLAELDDCISLSLPDLFDHRLRLQRLSSDGARQAILWPAQACGLDFETGLVDTILTDLEATDHGIDPPHLQIVSYRLWQDLIQHGEKIFTMAGYHRLGAVRQILTNYLNDSLDQLEDEGEEAKQLLKALVTSDATKSLLELDEIVRRSGLGFVEANTALGALFNLRLIRTLPGLHGIAYELSHEYLITEIQEWMSPEEKEARDIQDQLRDGLGDWRLLTLLMDEQHFKVVEAGIRKFNLVLSDAESELLFFSSLSVGLEMDYWLGRLSPGHALKLLGDASGDTLDLSYRVKAATRLPKHPSIQDAFAQEALTTPPLTRTRRMEIRSEFTRLMQRLCQSANPEIQAAALVGIGALPKLTPGLYSLVEKKMTSDMSETVRREAGKCLARFGKNRASDLIEKQRLWPFLFASVSTFFAALFIEAMLYPHEVHSYNEIAIPALMAVLGVVWVVYIQKNRLIWESMKFLSHCAWIAVFMGCLIAGYQRISQDAQANAAYLRLSRTVETTVASFWRGLVGLLLFLTVLLIIAVVLVVYFKIPAKYPELFSVKQDLVKIRQALPRRLIWLLVKLPSFLAMWVISAILAAGVYLYALAPLSRPVASLFLDGIWSFMIRSVNMLQNGWMGIVSSFSSASTIERYGLIAGGILLAFLCIRLLENLLRLLSNQFLLVACLCVPLCIIYAKQYEQVWGKIGRVATDILSALNLTWEKANYVFATPPDGKGITFLLISLFVVFIGVGLAILFIVGSCDRFSTLSLVAVIVLILPHTLSPDSTMGLSQTGKLAVQLFGPSGENWLSALLSVWERADSRIISSTDAKLLWVFLLLTILALMLIMIINAIMVTIKSLIWNDPLEILCLLSFSPAIHLYLVQRSTALFWPTILLSFIFLSLYIFLKPGWSYLLADRPLVRRILAVGCGCALFLAILPAIFGAQTFLFFDILQYFAVGLIFASFSLLGESRYGNVAPWYQVCAVLLCIGPLAWIVLAGMTGLSDPGPMTYFSLGRLFHQSILRFGWVNLLISIAFLNWKIGSNPQLWHKIVQGMRWQRWEQWIPARYRKLLLPTWLLASTLLLFSSVFVVTGTNLLTFISHVAGDPQAVGYASGLVGGLAMTGDVLHLLKKIASQKTLAPAGHVHS